MALPLAVAFLRWRLLDTRLGIIFAPLTMALPVAALMLITTFSTSGKSIEYRAHTLPNGDIHVGTYYPV